MNQQPGHRPAASDRESTELPPHLSAYRLRVEKPTGRRNFCLRLGENRIGSTEGNEIILGVAGVSRRHARLEIAPGRLFLEDLDSRNGTRVDGRRFVRGLVKPGAKIALGPVVARLEEVDPSDVELALTLAPASKPGARPVDESTEGHSRTFASPAVETLEPLKRFLDHMAAKGLGWCDLTAALGVLARQLEARAAALLECRHTRGVVVLAAQGDVGPCLEDPVFHDLVGEVRRRASGRSAFSRGASGAYAVLTRGQPDSPVLGLVVRGDTKHSLASAAWLSVLVRLLDLARPQPDGAGDDGRPHRPELVFPGHWAPSSSTAMERLYDQLRSLLTSDLPVLITGETGVGKERIAAILHASSHRRQGPFVAINCAAVPAELLEAEMFGIGERVATGVAARRGRFRDAKGGTILLDEIGDMSPELQAKLLRVLQEKEVQPLGEAPVTIDVRIIAATNVDLDERVERGEFRRDLYYRIAGSVVRVPPLRERRDDIPALVELFIRRASRRQGNVPSKLIRGLTVKALELLCGYAWPGNIRELEHEVQRLVALCPEAEAIDATLLGERLRIPGEAEPASEAPLVAPLLATPDAAGGPPFQDLETLERQAVARALHHTGGNQVQAARLLGITRSSLRRRIRRFGL